MNCHFDRRKIVAYNENELSEIEMDETERHIAECKWCQRQLQQIQAINHIIEDCPDFEPPPEIRINIESMIQQEKLNSCTRTNGKPRRLDLLQIIRERFIPMMPQTAILAYVAVISFGIGSFFHRPDSSRKVEQNSKKVAQLERELDQLKSLFLVDSATNDNPSHRLQIIQTAFTGTFGEVGSTDQAFQRQALLRFLKEDPNPNVRYTVLQQLMKMGDDEQLREQLLQLLKLEQEPIVQLTMLQYLSIHKDQRLMPAAMELISDPNTLDLVKGYAAEAVRQLQGSDANQNKSTTINHLI